MSNTWPNGCRESLYQSQHESWNASHYPGTRQLCGECGRCEDDTMHHPRTDGPLCEDCYRLEFPEEFE